MIEFDRVSLAYDRGSPILAGLTFTIEEGNLVVVAGRTGSGKSTLLGAINGHVPHFTGGTVTGSIRVAGLDTATHPPRDLAGVVGVVGQDPLAGFVTDTVEEELAYGMEQLAVPSATMRVRVEETLDILGLAPLRRRALATLSGGEQQRVAIGSVVATGVRVLVLDEPTSALDPVSAEEVLAVVVRLVHDLGLTVVMAEHRLERVVGYADQVLLLDGAGGARLGEPAALMASAAVVPPVVALGRVAGWSPLPLTVRAARQRAGDLRAALAECEPAQYPRRSGQPHVGDGGLTRRGEAGMARPGSPSDKHLPAAAVSPGLAVRDAEVRYSSVPAVAQVTVAFAAGAITAVMGRNGSGKSSLLWGITGVQPMSGRLWVGGVELTAAGVAARRAHLRLVPQTATDVLYLPTVGAECDAADRDARVASGRCRKLLEAMAPGIDPSANPRDLSEGQKLALVVAIQVAASPNVLLLDEPTRGLDYPAKAALADLLADQARQGRCVVVVTHDVEFAATAADHIVVMASGEVIEAAPTPDVLASSALFTTQVAKVMYPEGWLTPYQVAAALRGRDA